MSELNESSSRKKRSVPRGKSHRETETKTTVGVYLPKKTVEKARKHGLNLSRITEQALTSILDYLDTQNQEESSEFLSPGSFLKKVEWTGRDLNPRPPPCEGGVHTKLNYRPLHFFLEDNLRQEI